MPQMQGEEQLNSRIDWREDDSMDFIKDPNLQKRQFLVTSTLFGWRAEGGKENLMTNSCLVGCLHYLIHTRCLQLYLSFSCLPPLHSNLKNNKIKFLRGLRRLKTFINFTLRLNIQPNKN